MPKSHKNALFCRKIKKNHSPSLRCLLPRAPNNAKKSTFEMLHCGNDYKCNTTTLTSVVSVVQIFVFPIFCFDLNCCKK